MKVPGAGSDGLGAENCGTWQVARLNVRSC